MRCEHVNGRDASSFERDWVLETGCMNCGQQISKYRDSMFVVLASGDLIAWHVPLCTYVSRKPLREPTKDKAKTFDHSHKRHRCCGSTVIVYHKWGCQHFALNRD